MSPIPSPRHGPASPLPLLLTLTGLLLLAGCQQPEPPAARETPPGASLQGIESASTNLYGHVFMRRWPTSGGRTQWSDLQLHNPGNTPASATISIHGENGALLRTPFTVTVDARKRWRSSADSRWAEVLVTDTGTQGTLGWFRVSANQPLFGTSRISIRDGTAESGVVRLFSEEPLVSTLSRTLYTSYYQRNIPSAGGLTQSSFIALVNPNPTAATVRVNIWGEHGGSLPLATIDKRIDPWGRWSTYGDSTWEKVPGTDGQDRARGWVEVLSVDTSPLPLFGSNRTVIRDSAGGVVLFDEQPLVSATATSLYADTFSYNEDHLFGGTHQQLTTLTLNNPSDLAATATVTVFGGNGAPLGQLTKELGPRSLWSVPADSAWQGQVNPLTSGWVRVSSSRPLFGVNRVAVRDSANPGGPLIAFRDRNLEVPPPPSGQPMALNAAYAFARWFAVPDRSQWTDLRVLNPTDTAATAFVSIRTADTNGILGSLTVTIPARGYWSSGSALNGMTASEPYLADPGDASKQRTLGWVQVISSAPLVAANRQRIVAGPERLSPLVGFDDVTLVRSAVPAPKSGAPNIIVVLTDDLDVPTFEAMRTRGLLPNIQEHLTEAGTTFTESFVSDSLCCPSRATMLTGQYPHNTGVVHNEPPNGGHAQFRLREHSTLATWLHDHGYRTGYFGKYVNGFPASTYVTAPGAVLTQPPGWDTWNTSSTAPSDVNAFIQGAQPYLLMVAVHEPHVDVGAVATTVKDYPDVWTLRAGATDAGYTQPPAYVVTPEDRTLVAGSGPWLDTGSPAFNEPDATYARKPAWMRTGGLFPEDAGYSNPALDIPLLKGRPRLTAQDVANLTRQQIDRAASLRNVDRLVGSLFDTLGTQGVNNTVVVFTSDNGYMLGMHRLGEKRAAYEEAIRVPLIIRPPGPSLPRATSGLLALNNDLAPTLATYAGVTPPPEVDGRPLQPLLQATEPTHWRKRFLVEYLFNLEPASLSDPPAVQRSKAARRVWEIASLGGVREVSSQANDVLVEHYHPTSQALWDGEYYRLTTDRPQVNNLYGTQSASCRQQQLQSLLQPLRACGGEECRELEDRVLPACP